MGLPSVRGVIDRRIPVNYRVEPDALAAALPDPFEPQIVNGYGVGGICLIRLRTMRPAGVPGALVWTQSTRPTASASRGKPTTGGRPGCTSPDGTHPHG